MRSSRQPQCPCCQFLPDDLFLTTASTSTSENETYYRDQTRPTADGLRLEGDATDISDPMLPTDQAALDTVPQEQILAPLHAWERIRGSCLCLVDTHSHPHLGRPDVGDEPSDSDNGKSIYHTDMSASSDTACTVLSLTCAVAPSDWESSLRYASQSQHRMAALGVHPWYLDEVLNRDGELEVDWLERLKEILLAHPHCMVGEIGLCKQARFLRTYSGGKQQALQLQRDVFVKQLTLATHFQRSVSVHCVNQQGVLLDVLQSLDTELPPAIALHSFTGTAHQVQQLLQWEARLSRPSSDSPLLYFGFSHVVNFGMCSSEKARRQGRDAVRAIPFDRLLTESDVHSTADVVGGTAGAAAYLAWALSKPLKEVTDATARNGLRFLQQQLLQAPQG